MPSKVRRWTGSLWQECYLYRWSGSAWVLCGVYRWNGVMWIAIHGEVPLYNEGNEYAATTGGYVSTSGGTHAASSQYGFNGHTCLYTGASGGTAALHTAAMVDLTNLSYIYADYNYRADYAVNGISAVFGASKTYDFSANWSNASNLAIFSAYQALVPNGNVLVSGRFALDVRGLTGTYYIGQRACGWGGQTAELAIYKMWGE